MSTDNVGLHRKNLFRDDAELIREATTEESSVVQIEGNRAAQRKKQESADADQQDEAELKALETKLKRRSQT